MTNPAPEDLINTGVHAFNTAPTDTATLIITGLERSGTTMVARMLQELGINMGDAIGDAVREDREIYQALEQPSNAAAFRDIVARKNAEHAVWGWKRPRAFRYMDRYIKTVRNPRFIIPFRDPLAIATRNEISVFSSVRDNLISVSKDLQDLTAFVRDLPHPCFCFSYEKALTHREAFAYSLLEFLGMPPTPDRLRAVVSVIDNGDPDYLHSSRIRYDMGIDVLTKNAVKGWARRLGAPDKLIVEIRIDGEIQAEFAADHHRRDLGRKKIGFPAFGFAHTFPEPVERKRVSVTLQATGAQLPRQIVRKKRLDKAAPQPEAAASVEVD